MDPAHVVGRLPHRRFGCRPFPLPSPRWPPWPSCTCRRRLRACRLRSAPCTEAASSCSRPSQRKYPDGYAASSPSPPPSPVPPPPGPARYPESTSKPSAPRTAPAAAVRPCARRARQRCTRISQRASRHAAVHVVVAFGKDAPGYHSVPRGGGGSPSQPPQDHPHARARPLDLLCPQTYELARRVHVYGAVLVPAPPAASEGLGRPHRMQIARPVPPASIHGDVLSICGWRQGCGGRPPGRRVAPGAGPPAALKKTRSYAPCVPAAENRGRVAPRRPSPRPSISGR